MTRKKRTFGEVSRLPSGRYRARYSGPDGERHPAPHTFDTKGDAHTWLTLRHAEILKAEWTPPTTSGRTFGPYAVKWLSDRKLKERTREHYQDIITRHLAPFADVPLRKITPGLVATWHADLDTGPTMRAHSYALLRTIMKTALAHDLITANPCRVERGGTADTVHKTRPASLDELAALVAAMPPELQSMVLLASWCAMRFGELAALRRSDLDPDATVIRIRRGVVRVRGQMMETTPKTAAGRRDVAVPPHLSATVAAHIAAHAQPDRNGLLFPSAKGSFLPTVTLYKHFYAAREAAGRPDLRFHDLRHTGAVLAASTGATLAELMARLGHSTAGAAMRYQHATDGRDAVIAAKLSELVRG